MEVVGDLEYRGKLGNLVFYTMNGRTFARRVRIPGKKRKPRTEGQRGMARRFAIVQKMYSFYKEEISPDIWRLAGKAAGRRGNMLFTSLNSGCFDGEGRMADPEAFHFSAGSCSCRGSCGWRRWVEGGSGRHGRTSGRCRRRPRRTSCARGWPTTPSRWGFAGRRARRAGGATAGESSRWTGGATRGRTCTCFSPGRTGRPTRRRGISTCRSRDEASLGAGRGGNRWNFMFCNMKIAM